LYVSGREEKAGEPVADMGIGAHVHLIACRWISSEQA
jgi:hypothetical protein